MARPRGNRDCYLEPLAKSCTMKLARAIFNASGEEDFAGIADRRTCIHGSKKHKELGRVQEEPCSSLPLRPYLFFNLLKLSQTLIAFFVFG